MATNDRNMSKYQPTGQRDMAYSSKWDMTILEIQTCPTHSDKLMHGFVKFLIVLLCSLLLRFCTYCNLRTIQYNAVHKLARVLQGCQPPMSSNIEN